MMPAQKSKNLQKIAKLIANRTPLSRRSAEKAILDGRVKIDDRTPEISERISENANIFLDGKKLELPDDKNIYILLNKPQGFAVTKKDRYQTKTIWELLPQFKDKINSAGRLDRDSEGLIILTNDGDFIECLTHPKYNLTKTYRVTVKGNVSEQNLQMFTDGIKLDDGIARAKSAKLINKNELELVLTEGRKREVRRMCKSQKLFVLRLVRIAIGSIFLKDLSVGNWRYLSEKEIESLGNSCKNA